MWLFLACHSFPKTSLQELWIGFGPGKHYKDIPIHNVSEGLGAQRCEALPFLHAFTGSDITSFLRNVGKKTAFKVCDLHPELTDTFIKLHNKPSELTLEPLLMAALEEMAVQTNSPKCPSEDVNEVRKLLFITSLKPLESLPPTKHALYQHVKRSVLAAHHWIQALQKRPIILPPNNWGWVWNKRLEDLDAPLE